MAVEKTIASAFRMDDATWARHASPWSVYTRIPLLPILVAILWFGRPLGVWLIVPVLLWLVFVWFNPRLFAPPASTDNWASKAVMGERVWLNRKHIPIPRHHARFATGLSWASLLAVLIVPFGFIHADGWMAATGTAMATVFKVWFCDRMVWLFEDMKDASPEYRGWQKP